MVYRPRRRRAIRRRPAKRTRRPRKTVDSTLMKLSNSNGNRCIVSYGLAPQGLEPGPTAGTVSIVGPTPVTGYTGGPLVSSFVGTPTAGLFTVNNNTYDFGVGMAFSAQDISRFTPVSTNWDLYKIKKVQINIACLTNSESAQMGGACPTLYYVVDKDNNSVPGTASSVTGQAGYKKFQFSTGRSCTITFTPVLRLMAYTASGSGFAMVGPKYIDSANNPGVTHFGLKLWFTDVDLDRTASTYGHAFRFTYKYWIELKNPIQQY